MPLSGHHGTSSSIRSPYGIERPDWPLTSKGDRGPASSRERAAKGDQDAFGLLVHESLARLDGVARLILRDAELARDAVQETLVRAWRDLPGLRDPDRFDAWLRRLTVNACIDLARRRRRRVLEVELTPLYEPAVADTSAVIADRDLLDGALRRLEPEQRAIVVLR